MDEISVVGYGTMGKGIAQLLASKGYKVHLVGNNLKKVKDSLKDIEKNLDFLVKRKKITLNERNRIVNNICPCLGKKSSGKSKLIIEAVPENLKLKKRIFKRLDSLNKKAIIATNTSSLSVKEIASACKNKKRIIGMHFFNPVHAISLVEIVKTKYNDNKTINEALEFLKSLGKKPIVVEDSPGFIVNRLLIPMVNDAAFLLQNNVAAKEDIDKAMKLGANHTIGPLELADLIGLDIVSSIMKSLNKSLGNKYKPCQLLVKMVKNKKLGRKTKEGFYKY